MTTIGVSPGISANGSASKVLYKRWSRYSQNIVRCIPTSSRAQFWGLAARLAQYKAQNLVRNSEMNIRQIERRCREELGRTPQEWLNEQKLVAARWLLLEPVSIKRVALELGFKQVSHFCRAFKQVYGVTPSRFQLIQKQKAENSRK